MRPHVASWELYGGAVDAIDDVLHRLGYVHAEKAFGVLTASGYDRAVRALLRSIGAEVRTPERQAVVDAARRLDADWDRMSPARRNEVIEAASNTILKLPKVVAPKVAEVIGSHYEDLVQATKQGMKRQHELPFVPDLNAVDRRIIQHASRSQASYITSRYGTLSERFSVHARDLVAEGIDQGLDSAAIGKRLQSILVDDTLRTQASYWQMVASVHVTRARSWGQLSSYTDAGIERYVIVPVEDEVTCDACDYMDGKEFSTSDAVENWQAVEDADDPTDVEDLQPWIRTGTDDDGNSVLFVDKDGTRHGVARVARSAEGMADTHGSFTHGADSEKLQDLGVDTPPFHGNCRCTTVPA